MRWRFHMCQACFLSLLTTVQAESHSIRQYISVVTNPIGFPAYTLKVYIDDVELASYNDETNVFQTSLKGPVNADYWADHTLATQNMQRVHKQFVTYVNSVLNQTHGENIYQRMFACTVDEDGKYDGYLQYAQNGKDFTTFDKDKILYIPMTFQSQIITEHFNKNTVYGPIDKHGIEIKCPQWLQNALKFASYELERKVRPEVKVWDRLQPDRLTRLYCLVYGFYPRAVDVKWMRNGVDHVPSDEMTPILPHPDGTYQIRVSVEVPTKEGDTYFCHVDHSSLGDETLSEKWEPKKESIHIGVAAAFAFAFVFLGALGIVIFRFRKQKTEE